MKLDSDSLTCPICDRVNLHQVRVEVFDRPKEDADTGLFVSVEEGEAVSFLSGQHRNPSQRRNGLRILFRCEHCETGLSPLVIFQYKGETRIKWEGSS